MNTKNNSEAPKSDESVINKTEVEKSLTDRLMSMNTLVEFIQYVIGTISSCEQKMIEMGKKSSKDKQ